MTTPATLQGRVLTTILLGVPVCRFSPTPVLTKTWVASQVTLRTVVLYAPRAVSSRTETVETRKVYTTSAAGGCYDLIIDFSDSRRSIRRCANCKLWQDVRGLRANTAESPIKVQTPRVVCAAKRTARMGEVMTFQGHRISCLARTCDAIEGPTTAGPTDGW